MYAIYNEDGEKMRVVQRKEEAEQLVATRTDWTFKFFRPPSQEPLFYRHNFEEAPF